MSKKKRERNRSASGPIKLDLSAPVTEVDKPEERSILAYLKKHWIVAGLIALFAFGVLASGLKYLEEDAKREIAAKPKERSLLSSDRDGRNPRAHDI